MQIQFTQAPEFANDLEAKLLRELRAKSAQGQNKSFSLDLVGANGTSLGGVTTSCAYGWLLIKVLFVEPSARGQGHGRALLDAALAKGQDLGCHSAWLDTSDENARQFYCAQRFVPFGNLFNDINQIPAGHQRWFLKRVM